MKDTSISSMACRIYRDQLDSWLAQELDAALVPAMQAHQEVCAACQKETRLALAIDQITAVLPTPACPDLGATAAAQTKALRASRRLTTPQASSWPGRSVISRLVLTWRQPLVFIPAAALVVAALGISQLPVFSTPGEPGIVIIDGDTYTAEEIVRAARDLDLALRYLDKYGSYPARVVQFQLEQSRLPLPPPQEGSGAPSI